jgi:uncharacterized membrane protein (UPF0127 family)
VHGRFPAVQVADADRRAAAADPPAARRAAPTESGVGRILTFLDPLLARPGNAALPGAGDERRVLVNARTGMVVARTIETAFDSDSRNRGLLGRDAFAPGSALILAPCSSIHMFFMRFAIDAAFVDRQGRILRTAANLRPWRIAIALRAYAVIELPAGTLEAADTRAGDVLRIDPA